MILFAVFFNSVCGVIKGCCVGNWFDAFCKEEFSEIRAFLKLQAQGSAFRWLTDPFTLKKDFLGCNDNEVVQELCNFLLVCDVLYFVIYFWEVKSDYGGTSRVSFRLIMGKNLNFNFQLHPFVNQVFAVKRDGEIFFVIVKPLFFLWKWKSPCFCLKGSLFWLLNLLHILTIPFLIAHAAAPVLFYAPRFIPLVCCCCSLEVRQRAAAWEAVLMEQRGVAREGLSSFGLEEGALSHLSQKERTFRCLLPETDLLSIL